nr:hypothetical protein CFP56_13007 [Quercus suber]
MASTFCGERLRREKMYKRSKILPSGNDIHQQDILSSPAKYILSQPSPTPPTLPSNMQLQYAALAAFAVAATASPMDFFKRQSSTATAATVVNDLKLAGSDTVKLNGTVNQQPNAGTYTVNQLITLQGQNQQIIYDVGNATKSVNATKTYNSADSSSIYSAGTALYPTVSTVLHNFELHYQAFKNGGVQGVVKQSLQDQREQVREFGNAVQTKLAAPYNTQAPKAIASQLALFDHAIGVYNQ